MKSLRFLFAVALASALALASGGAVAGAWGGPGASTLFVATGGNDSHPCTFVAPCRTIGHAVSLAAPGSTIIVGPGRYTESVVVPTRVSLIGRGAVIDAAGLVNGITVTGPASAGSSVSGFTVEHAFGEGILAVSTSNLTIGWNWLHDNDLGTGTNVTMECQDQGNVPGDCGEALHLMGVSGSRVLANHIDENVGGILVTDEVGPSHGNLIAFNTSVDNHDDCGITLPSHNGAAVGNPAAAGVYDNTVIANFSSGNGGAGVGMFAPFPGTASYNNRVIGNTLTNNGEAGIAIHAHAPGQNVSGNSIIGNLVSGNGIDPDSGSGHPTGIALFSAAVPVNTTVVGNHVSNEFWGIFINGSFTVRGLPFNSYRNVTQPVGP